MQTNSYDAGNNEPYLTINEISRLFRWTFRETIRWLRTLDIKSPPQRPGWFLKDEVFERHRLNPTPPPPLSVLKLVRRYPGWISGAILKKDHARTSLNKTYQHRALRYKPNKKYRTPKPMKSSLLATNIGFAPSPKAAFIFEALKEDLGQSKNSLIKKIICTVDWLIKNPATQTSPFIEESKRIIQANNLTAQDDLPENNQKTQKKIKTIGLRGDIRTRVTLTRLRNDLKKSANSIINESVLAFDSLVRDQRGNLPAFIRHCRAILGPSG